MQKKILKLFFILIGCILYFNAAAMIINDAPNYDQNNNQNNNQDLLQSINQNTQQGLMIFNDVTYKNLLQQNGDNSFWSGQTDEQKTFKIGQDDQP